MSKNTKSSVQKERTKEQIDKLLIKIPDAKLPGYCQHKGRNKGYCRPSRNEKPLYLEGKYGSDPAMQSWINNAA